MPFTIKFNWYGHPEISYYGLFQKKSLAVQVLKRKEYFCGNKEKPDQWSLPLRLGRLKRLFLVEIVPAKNNRKHRRSGLLPTRHKAFSPMSILEKEKLYWKWVRKNIYWN